MAASDRQVLVEQVFQAIMTQGAAPRGWKEWIG